MFEIDGYIIVLQRVQCIYPVEKTHTGYSFGFKYTNGFYETFDFKTKSEAFIKRKGLLTALKEYLQK